MTWTMHDGVRCQSTCGLSPKKDQSTQFNENPLRCLRANRNFEELPHVREEGEACRVITLLPIAVVILWTNRQLYSSRFPTLPYFR